MQTASIIEALAGPFSPTAIHWRVGAMKKDKSKGIALAYLDARDVMERLDTVVGPANWQNRYPMTGCCELGIRLDGEWVWKANGAGQSDIEAEKGQFSDAFKRAAVLWGVGRYLYDLPNVWVALDNYKRITDAEQAQLTDRLAKWQTKYFTKGEAA